MWQVACCAFCRCPKVHLQFISCGFLMLGMQSSIQCFLRLVVSHLKVNLFVWSLVVCFFSEHGCLGLSKAPAKRGLRFQFSFGFRSANARVWSRKNPLTSATCTCVSQSWTFKQQSLSDPSLHIYTVEKYEFKTSLQKIIIFNKNKS